MLGANSPYSECFAPDSYEINAYLARMERLSHNISRQRQHFMWMNADATLGTSVGENGDTVYILSWEQGGVSNTIMGNISRDEIVKIAENVF